MTRFWTRFIQPFQQKRKDNSKKKLPVIVFDEYAKPPSYLKDSCLYGHALVRVDRLESAYSQIDLSQYKKTSSSYWKLMDPFIQVWCNELERVSLQCQNALSVLNSQLEDVSHILRAVSSPLKNRDRQSLKQAQQFIHTCIKEWDQNTNRNTTIAAMATATAPAKNNKSNTRSVIVTGTTSDITLTEQQQPSTNQQQLFLETTLQHKTSSLIRNSQFQTYYQELEGRLEQGIKPTKNKHYDSSHNPRLRQCKLQIHQFEQDLILYHHYITSQFSILWDLGNISLGSSPTSPSNQQQNGKEGTEPTLIQVLKIKLDQKMNQQLKAYQELESNFRSMLNSSTPDREDFTCAVCLSILNEPTTLSGCHHTFCRSCIQHMFCAFCHRNREKTFNRISENLGSLLMKPLPAVYCTCHIIDSTTGEVVLKNAERACPLCRTAFKPNQCTTDVALDKFISLYFPKRRYDDDDNNDNEQEDEKKKNKKQDRKKKKETPSSSETAAIATNSSDRLVDTTVDSHNADGDSTNRRSQIGAGKFYSKMQRWSHKWTQGDIIVNLTDETPPVPSVPSQQRAYDDMLILARRSWIF